MIKIYRKVLVLALLALPILSQAQSLDTVIVKQLKTGWNLVGYMGQTPEQTQEAFAGIKDKLLEVKSMDGFYTPDQQAYLNSLKTINPLDGVMLKVNQDCELKRTIKKSAILYHDTEKQSLADVLAIGNSAKGQIKNVSDPTDPQDAVNKASVTLRVSATGDSLFMGKAQFVIIPGISAANPVESGICNLTDFDGNVYTCVTIGNQVWMAENLKTTKYANGTPIPFVNTDATWDALTTTSKAYCWYNDDITNKATYGALYTWAAAMNGAASVTANPSGIQGVCPAGWHLPSDAEWTQMENYLADNGHNYDGTTGGGSTKIAKSLAGTSGWMSSSSSGAVGNTDYHAYRNKSGFTALPGGKRGYNFLGIGYYGGWWSATQSDISNAWPRSMESNYSSLGNSDTSPKSVGFSVRCVKD